MLPERPDPTSGAWREISVRVLGFKNLREQICVDADTGFAKKHQVLEHPLHFPFRPRPTSLKPRAASWSGLSCRARDAPCPLYLCHSRASMISLALVRPPPKIKAVSKSR